MRNLMRYIFGILALGIGVMVFISSCDRQDETYLVGNHRLSEQQDNEELGISFNLESDSLVEEIEEIYF